jgi:hypothetical protein
MKNKQGINPMRVRKIALATVCLLLLSAMLLLGGCAQVAQNNENHKDLCEQFLDAVLANDEDAAFALFDAELGLDRGEFSKGFSKICSLFDGVKTLEKKQVGWNYESKNGTTLHQTTFELTADNGKTYTLFLLTVEGVEGIYDISVRDNGNFKEEAARFSPLNIILKVLSALFFIGTVVLIVDCLRSKIRNRVLWAILMVLGLAFTLTIGAGTANVHFSLGLLVTVMGVKASAAASTVAITFYLPIGAIVYLCRRGHMRRIAEAEERMKSSFDLPGNPPSTPMT